MARPHNLTLKISFKSLRKKSFICFAIYLMAIIIAYTFPVGLDSEWYSFYRYLDEHNVFPYLDVREGYPPIGFLVYMPLYWLCNSTPSTFSYCFRFLNGFILVSVLIVLFLLLREEVVKDKALKYTLIYGALPSVVISNTYSNDVVALLFAVLAIYAMVKERPKLCGLLIGLAALSKGFPALLIVPALIKLKEVRAKVEVAGVFILTLLIISLPFLALNPLAYISTFIHHGSRGPWETIWALIDGYYSHGGLLHPYFDKFFYHGNLMKVYFPNRYDHAFYLWRYDWLPNLLTLGQVLIIIVLALTYARLSDETIKLCGLIYLAYMFFFKGYSTQFSVSTPLYLLLASGSIAPLIPVEVSHMMQILSWTYIPQINLRNVHMHLLVSSILIRTTVFAYILASSLKSRIPDLRYAFTIIVRSLAAVKWILSDKRILILAAFSTLLGCALIIQVYGYLRQEDFFRSISGAIDLTVDRWENITLSGLERNDKILVKLYTNTRIETYVTPGAFIERGIRNKYNLRCSFNETLLFFRATSGQHTLSFRMAHPKIPFRVTDGINGDLKSVVKGNGTILIIDLVDGGLDGKDSIFRIAYPYETYIGEDFKVNLKYKVISTNDTVPTIILDIFDETDEWLYAFKVTDENFILTPDTADINGHANLIGDHMSLIALSITIKDGGAATVLLKNLSIGDQSVVLSTEDNETVRYEIYVEKAFKVSEHYLITLLLLIISVTCTLLLAIMRTDRVISL